MTKPTEAVNYPYDWVDPQAEYWAIHARKKSQLRSAEDENSDWQLQRARDLQNVFPYDPYESRQWIDNAPVSDPWSNGRYALAAVVWGLIILVVFGVGAGP